MSSELSGWALRRAVCEAVGWKVVPMLNGYYYHGPACPGSKYVAVTECEDNNCSYHGNEYESDATLSEALLDEKCRENGFWEWRVQVASHRKGYACTIWGGPDGKVVAHADGKDPSEARMRALLMALRSPV